LPCYESDKSDVLTLNQQVRQTTAISNVAPISKADTKIIPRGLRTPSPLPRTGRVHPKRGTIQDGLILHVCSLRWVSTDCGTGESARSLQIRTDTSSRSARRGQPCGYGCPLTSRGCPPTDLNGPTATSPVEHRPSCKKGGPSNVLGFGPRASDSGPVLARCRFDCGRRLTDNCSLGTVERGPSNVLGFVSVKTSTADTVSFLCSERIQRGTCLVLAYSF